MRPLDVAASSSPSSPDVPAQPAPQPARPDTALTDALARLAQRYDLRARPANAAPDEASGPGAPVGAVAVVERAFHCGLPRLDCVRALREGWARLAFAAVGQKQAAVARAAVQAVPLPTGDVPGDVPGDDTPIVTASLWPAPSSIVAARRETIAGLGRAAGVPAGVWEAASGAVGDAAVPPGVVRLLLPANLKVELSDAAAHETAAKAEAPEPWAATQLTVAALDLVEGPRGAFGRARAVAVCQSWLEQLIETAGLGAAWRWTDAGMGAPPAQAAATATAAPPEDAGHGATPHGHGRTERLHALQAAYVALCRLYRDRGEPRRPRLADFADNQGLSVATMKRLLHDLGADWRCDFATVPLDAGASEPV